MTHLHRPFKEMTPEAQQAFLDLVESDKTSTPPYAKSVYIPAPSGYAWMFIAALFLCFAFITTQIQSEPSMEIEIPNIEIQSNFTVDIPKDQPTKTVLTEPEPAVPFWISATLGGIGLGFLLYGIFFQVTLVKPPWPSRLYFTDGLLIDARSRTLVFIPLADIKSVEMEEKHSYINGASLHFYFVTIYFHSDPTLSYRPSSGQQSNLDKDLEQAVYDKVNSLVANPPTDAVYRIGNVDLM